MKSILDFRKFVCLNDNLDESKDSENELVKAILYDFYMSLFPHPSKFELPEDFRNKFDHMQELKDWRNYRHNIKLFIYFLMFTTSFLAVYSFCRKKCCQITNKLLFCWLGLYLYPFIYKMWMEIFAHLKQWLPHGGQWQSTTSIYLFT